MIAMLTPDEQEVIRRAMEATFKYFDWDFQTRLGVYPSTMLRLLGEWPEIDDRLDDSDGCLAINNVLNDLLFGVGISERESQALIGVSRVEMDRVYRKWRAARGWPSIGEAR